MKLENQVCSLELANKLNALGVKQESLFWWQTKFYDVRSGKIVNNPHTGLNDDDYIWYSAFTVAELGEMLPYTALGAYLNEFKGKDCWSVGYGLEKTIIDEPKHADARAKMLIYLLENKLI